MFNRSSVVLVVLASLVSTQAVGAPLERLFPDKTPPLLTFVDDTKPAVPSANPTTPEPVDPETKKFAEECPYAVAFSWNDWKGVTGEETQVIVSLEGADRMPVLSPVSSTATVCYQTLPAQPVLLQVVLASVTCPAEGECNIKPDFSNARPLLVAEYLLQLPAFNMGHIERVPAGRDYRPALEMPEAGFPWQPELFIGYASVKRMLEEE